MFSQLVGEPEFQTICNIDNGPLYSLIWYIYSLQHILLFLCFTAGHDYIKQVVLLNSVVFPIIMTSLANLQAPCACLFGWNTYKTMYVFSVSRVSGNCDFNLIT